MSIQYLYQDGRLQPTSREPVREYPLRLQVNGRELATLIASPHELRPLVVGFLRLQGFIETLDDLLVLAVCDDFGVANVRIRGELPERLRPILTSGCGTGVTYNLDFPAGHCAATGKIAPAAIFRLLESLAERAEGYRRNGGLHSAAIGDAAGNLLLFAEDIGRHNTIDRLAGEALLKGIDLSGCIIATSGRVSTELAAKAVRLGLTLIASRSAATDMAAQLCEQAGIALVGYARGGKLTIYVHSQRLDCGNPRIPGVTGVILAGGESRRMGCNKSLLPLHGGLFIDHVHRTLAELFDEVLIVTNSPELYVDLPCRKVADIYPLRGSLPGIHSALCHARHDKIFVVACDMPFLSAAAIRLLCDSAPQDDVVIPRSAHGLEPLHALYDRRCLAPVEAVLDAGEKRIVAFFPRVQVREVEAAAFAACDPTGRSFANINTPQEYYALRQLSGEQNAPRAGSDSATG